MPARHRTKEYIEDGYYHIYNRGVEKRLIFLDEQDYGVFLSYLKEYLVPKNEKELGKQLADPKTTCKEKNRIRKLLRLNNFSDEIILIAYSLMTNHFHLFLKQKSAGAIDKFMNSIATRYTMYFNKKYQRVGALCQDTYKAVLILTDEQFLYLSKYIHQQALLLPAVQGVALHGWQQPSSYPEYLGKRKTEWVKQDEVLTFFSKTNPKLSYEAFVLDKDEELILLSGLSLED